MNRWQAVFVTFGVVTLGLLAGFPPQFTRGTVQFLPFTEGNPIDWLRLFLWVLAVVFFTALGYAANQEEHG